MPLSNADRARAFDQAVGLVRGARDAGRLQLVSERADLVRDIGRRLFENNPLVSGRSVQSYMAVARRALQSADLVDEMRADRDSAFRERDHPLTATNRPHDDRIEYRVVLSVLLPDGRTIRPAGTVTTDESLSYNAIVAFVEQSIDFQISPLRADRVTITKLPTGAIVQDVELISASRQR